MAIETILIGMIALFAVVPVFHLWLHALREFWKKFPVLLYGMAIAFWAFVMWLMMLLWPSSPVLFAPSKSLMTEGLTLVLIGLAMTVTSIFTLGPRRFFVWEVLRPGAASRDRVQRGIFKHVPHPAYIGNNLALVGAWLATGTLIACIAMMVSLALTPLVILHEEDELNRRVGGQP